MNLWLRGCDNEVTGDEKACGGGSEGEVIRDEWVLDVI